MSQFLSKLNLQDNGDRTFTLLSDLLYSSDYLNLIVVVPAGFKTDLASIPRGLWNILPPIDGYDFAAVVHDWMYQTGEVEITGHPSILGENKPFPQHIDRGDADRILLEGMAASNVGWFKRWAIYLGVRAGGWIVWGRYRDRETAVDIDTVK